MAQSSFFDSSSLSDDWKSTDMKNFNIRMLTGNANPKLARDVVKHVGANLDKCIVEQFADGEINIHIKENVRGADVYVVQPTCSDVNRNLMELLLLIHTLRLSSAKRITAVVPYFGYARQDRKTKPRVPISASAVAQLIESMGPHRLITVDLHCGQIQGFFHQTPVDNLFAEDVFINEMRDKLSSEKFAIVSPDAGGVTRAKRFADKMNASSIVTILKRRVAANVVESMQLVGDVNGMTCLIVDDIIDTAGTLTKAAEHLIANGAVKVFACATHGVFSGPAMERINDSVLDQVWVSDSIPQESNLEKCPKLKCVSLAPLLAQAICRLHTEKSLSALFDKD